MDLKKELDLMDEKYKGKGMIDILGKGSMTMADRVNASRGIMCSGNMDQYVDLLHAEHPIVSTTAENVVGKYSSGYYEAEHDMKVISKISKFSDYPNSHYLLVVYNKRKKMYDIVTRNYGHILTEHFAYKNKNDIIDDLSEGDDIEKGDVLYRATSYDDDMNYCFGSNPVVMYGSDSGVIEDGMVMNREFAEKMVSIEYETIPISYNDNDILLNLYGEKDEYKVFPDINESADDWTICAKRTLNFSEVLHSLKNLDTLSNTDTIYYSAHTSKNIIVDINICSNKPYDKIPDTPYNAQIRRYLKMQRDYNKKIYDVLGEIMASGEKYSDDVSYEFARAQRQLDPDYVWESRGKVFSNMLIEIVVERHIPGAVGSKWTARYGNKGVISTLRDPKDMPVTEDGQVVDIILSPLGIVGRLNGAQLLEMELNFIGDGVIKLIKDMDSLQDRVDTVAEFLTMVNPDHGGMFNEYVSSISYEQKETLIDEMIQKGIPIVVPPIGDTIRIEQLYRIYKHFDIKPVTVYVKKWGRMVPIKRKTVVGRMFYLKLKHHASGKLSARSTGVVSSKDLPIKSGTAKHNMLYSNTSIKLGEQEALNLLINQDPAALNKLIMTHGDSIVGRKDLCQTFDGEIFPEEIKLSRDATNRSSEVLRCIMKAMGVGMKIVTDGDVDDF